MVRGRRRGRYKRMRKKKKNIIVLKLKKKEIGAPVNLFGVQRKHLL